MSASREPPVIRGTMWANCPSCGARDLWVTESASGPPIHACRVCNAPWISRPSRVIDRLRNGYRAGGIAYIAQWLALWIWPYGRALRAVARYESGTDGSSGREKR